MATTSFAHGAVRLPGRGRQLVTVRGFSRTALAGLNGLQPRRPAACRQRRTSADADCQHLACPCAGRQTRPRPDAGASALAVHRKRAPRRLGVPRGGSLAKTKLGRIGRAAADRLTRHGLRPLELVSNGDTHLNRAGGLEENAGLGPGARPLTREGEEKCAGAFSGLSVLRPCSHC